MKANHTQQSESNTTQNMTNVALLIDWENIKCSSVNALGTPPDIITLKKIARKYGVLRIARAYANWTDSSGWHAGDVERLTAQGVEPVFVPTRHQTGKGSNKGVSYEKDLVDLRLACDGMELLATHPEIECYIVVSGDGALETLLTKLSAGGKRVVRVAVEASLAKGMRVLGEERVIYDDWVKGFHMSSSDKSVDEAVDKLVIAVEAIAAEGTDNGLHAVKERMRREQPDFEEEELGIPTFRHLAYMAESRGRIRVDASTEPARAYPNDVEEVSGMFLPLGITWEQFIRHLDPAKSHIKSGLEASLERVDLGMGSKGVWDLIKLALRSGVLMQDSESFVTRDRDSQRAKAISSLRYRLNAYHPRVQVVLAGI